MKKIILALTLSFGFTTAFSQESSEIKIGIGDATTFEALFDLENIVVDIFDAIFTGNTHQSHLSMDFPYLFVDYRFPLSNKVKIGAQVGYFGYSGTTQTFNRENFLIDQKDVKNSIVTFMPGLDYRYFERNKFKMYGNVMLGLAFISTKYDGDKESDTNFIYQINPIGFSYGDNTSIFAEFGLGVSIANLGVKFKL